MSRVDGDDDSTCPARPGVTHQGDRRDLASRLLAACVLTFGASRPDWGQAMLAELGRLEDRRTRWRFALGCARSIAFSTPPSGPQRFVIAGTAVGATASAGIVVIALLRYPGMVSGPRTWVMLCVFVALLLAYFLVAASAGPRVADSHLVITSVEAGAFIGATWIAIGVGASLDFGPALSVVLLVLGPVTAFVNGWRATARSGSTSVGVACVALTAVIAGYLLFLIWAGETVSAAGRPYDGGLLRDFRASGGTDLQTYAVNDSLGTGMVLLILVPLVCVVTGLVGAVLVSSRTPCTPYKQVVRTDDED